MNPDKPQARVCRRHSVLLSWLRSVSKACFGKNQLLEPVVSLDVISPREAVDRVQAVSSTHTKLFRSIVHGACIHLYALLQGVVEAVLYLDISAARGRKGHLGFTHRSAKWCPTCKAEVTPLSIE